MLVELWVDGMCRCDQAPEVVQLVPHPVRTEAAAALEFQQVLGIAPALVLLADAVATGTRTSVKNTWLTSWSPAMVMIGSTWTPGESMSINRKLMPCWGLLATLVRTRQNIWSARCACVVQILRPLTT